MVIFVILIYYIDVIVFDHYNSSNPNEWGIKGVE